MSSTSWDTAMMLVGFEGVTPPAVDRLAGVTEAYFGLEIGALLSKSRLRAIVMARHMMRAYMRSKWCMTLVRIAERTGCSEHATVMHSLEVHEGLMAVDRAYRREYAAYTAKMAEAGL